MKVLILGGGITGLSSAWFLKRKMPHADITLLEKENRLGGWMQTSREGGFLFERGPRAFPLGRSPHLLNLIRELNLEILSSAPQKRYIYHRGKLRSFGSFIPRWIPCLIREFFVSPSHVSDESIYDFAARRFNSEIAETLFDPLTLGIYAGEMRKLSLRSCFPAFYQWEQDKGSLLRGLFSEPKREKGLFTLKEGMETLVHTLQKRLVLEVVFNCPVESIGKQEVFAGGKTWRADTIISALPLPFPAKSLWVVHLAFGGDVLSKKGFGYLIPTREKESLLGVIFDSSIFPEQGKKGETRLTAMVRAEEKEPLRAVLSALDRHLRISVAPMYSSVFFAKHAISQLEIGCNYTEGIGVEASIQRALQMAHFCSNV